jgi:hypothetical protein
MNFWHVAHKFLVSFWNKILPANGSKRLLFDKQLQHKPGHGALSSRFEAWF